MTTKQSERDATGLILRIDRDEALALIAVTADNNHDKITVFGGPVASFTSVIGMVEKADGWVIRQEFGQEILWLSIPGLGFTGLYLNLAPRTIDHSWSDQ